MSRFIRRPREVFYIASNNRTAVRVSHFSLLVTEALKKIPGGYSWEFLEVVCHQILKILTLFQTKTCHFSHPFPDLPHKSIPVFRPGLQEITSSLLRLEQHQKRFLNIHFEFP